MSEYIITPDGELYHHGVKGMKWGVRKKVRPVAAMRSKYRKAKDKAFDDYEKTIRDIEKPYKRGQMLSKKDQARELAADARYQRAAAKAKQEFKNAKKERKQAIKSTTKELNKKATLGERLVYNAATRKKAAKYVVDHNMTMEQATKKSKAEAWRNTAIILGVAGGVAVASLRKSGAI